MKKFLLPILLGSYLSVSSQVFNAGTQYGVYDNITPDTLIHYTFPYSSETYSISMFSDPLKNIELTAHGAGSSGGVDAYIKVTSLSPNVYISLGRIDSVSCPNSSIWSVTKVARPLSWGEPINSGTAIWDNGTLYLTVHTGHSGCNKNVNDWIGGDKYIGIKYEHGSSVTYGWIRVRCITKDSCYIKDFSYSSIAVTMNEPNKEESVSVFPNPSSDIFSINLKNKAVATKILIFDVLGNCLLKKDFQNNANTKIDLSNQPKGVYFMEIVYDSERVVKKIILE